VLLYALELFPRDKLVCLDLDVILDNELIGNICATPLSQCPAWTASIVCEDPVEPFFFNAMLTYLWSMMLIIGLRFIYLGDGFLIGKFMIIDASFINECFSLQQLERIWGSSINEDFRLATILKQQCNRTTRVVDWPVYIRKAEVPATAGLLWSKSRRWMQGIHLPTIQRIFFFALDSKPLLALAFFWFGVLDSTSTAVLYGCIFVSEALGVTLIGRVFSPVRFLQMLVCGLVWECIMPWMVTAWVISQRFTWYKRTYVMSYFADEMMYVIDNDDTEQSKTLARMSTDCATVVPMH
jgi:hypothetical protein